jgi:hypothetical protein
MTRVTFLVSALVALATANPASADVRILREQAVAKFSTAESDHSHASAWEGYRRCHWTWPARTRLWCTRPHIRG